MTPTQEQMSVALDALLAAGADLPGDYVARQLAEVLTDHRNGYTVRLIRHALVEME